MAKARASSQADSLGGCLPKDCHRRQSRGVPCLLPSGQGQGQGQGAGTQGWGGVFSRRPLWVEQTGASQERRQSGYVGILGGHRLLCPCQPRVGEDTVFIRTPIQPGPYSKPWQLLEWEGPRW